MANKLRVYLLSSLITLILIFVSCSTLSPAGSSPNAAANVAANTARVFPSLQTVEPEWEVLTNGVGYFHGKVASPRMEFWALRVYLNSSGISVFVNGDAKTVTGFVRDNNLLAGINTTPFNDQYKNVGVIISGNVLYSPAINQYDALVFYKDGQTARAAIVSQASIYSMQQNIENAVGGFHKILIDGQPAERTLREGTVSAQRHPRSAAGVSSNGSILYLLVIDGRRPGSTGATELETALLLRALGSHEALNLDGGGSSALAIRSPNGAVKTVNTPSGFGRERTVTGCLGIFNNY